MNRSGAVTILHCTPQTSCPESPNSLKYPVWFSVMKPSSVSTTQCQEEGLKQLLINTVAVKYKRAETQQIRHICYNSDQHFDLFFGILINKQTKKCNEENNCMQNHEHKKTVYIQIILISRAASSWCHLSWLKQQLNISQYEVFKMMVGCYSGVVVRIMVFLINYLHILTSKYYDFSSSGELYKIFEQNFPHRKICLK